MSYMCKTFPLVYNSAKIIKNLSRFSGIMITNFLPPFYGLWFYDSYGLSFSNVCMRPEFMTSMSCDSVYCMCGASRCKSRTLDHSEKSRILDHFALGSTYGVTILPASALQYQP